jgi:succinoglycan biosynthesis protein ExoM
MTIVSTLLSPKRTPSIAAETSPARLHMSSHNVIRVAVCVVTFRRQKLLRRLLNGIAQLRFRRVPAPEIQVVVVDNDERASARNVCRGPGLASPMKYVVEPTRGISWVRNRAITEAGLVDFIAFIDDDEVPAVWWLDELLWAQAKFSADVISGPVLPSYDPEVAQWVMRGKFFSGRVAATGTELRACATNNVLIGTHIFRSVPKFDDAFALSGAEDTNFFLRVQRAGYKIVWAQEAVVFETVPPERATIRWLVRREFQTGNGWVFCETGMDSRLRKRFVRLFKACGHVVIGSAKAISLSIVLDGTAIVRSLMRVSLGVGMLAALAGHRFLAYREHGKLPTTRIGEAARRAS